MDADGSGPADETFETVSFHYTALKRLSIKPSVGIKKSCLRRKLSLGPVRHPDSVDQNICLGCWESS